MSASTSSKAPFPSSCALSRDRLTIYADAQVQDASSLSEDSAGPITYVPGEPAVNLLPNDIYIYLSDQLCTPLLDELYEKLWVVAKKSGQNIDPLHTQRVKGRSIVATEDPKLHLLWHHDKIYIKPVPVCLLNHDFWTMFLHLPTQETSSQSLYEPSQRSSSAFERSIALGFLRSYALLIPHRLDFVLAKEAHLIPDDVEDWLQWSKFIRHFRHLTDESVARRYHYGQLRLSRLNWAVRIFHPQQATTMWFYEVPHFSIVDFITRATVPLLFLFASVSLALSSMQVTLSVPADDPWFDRLGASRLMGRAFWVFSVAVILGWVVIWALFLSIPLIALAWQVIWGFRREQKRRSLSGVVGAKES